MAVALVAVAAKGLVTKTAKDSLTVFIMLTSAALSFTFEAPWLYPALIVGGGLTTLIRNACIHRNMALPVRLLISVLSAACMCFMAQMRLRLRMAFACWRHRCSR